MVKSKTSDAYENKRFYDTQREGFRKIAEQAEQSSSKSVRNRELAETARAAEQLVGTQRARDLVNDGMFKNLKADMNLTQEPMVGSHAMGILEKLLSNEAFNKPLGSSLTHNEWQAVKDAVQREYAALEAKGYTKAEVAAALAYERYLVRGEAKSRAKSSRIPRNARAITITINGRATTYYEQNGMLMRSSAIGTTRGMPAGSNSTLAQMYANAIANGYSVQTHTAADVEAANKSYSETRRRNAQEIANAETSGTRQSKNISRQSGRIKSRRRR